MRHSVESLAIVVALSRLAVSVEHRLVTDRQTYDYGIYRASMASRGKNLEKCSFFPPLISTS